MQRSGEKFFWVEEQKEQSPPNLEQHMVSVARSELPCGLSMIGSEPYHIGLVPPCKEHIYICFPE